MVASRSVLRHIWFRRTHRPLGPALEVGPRRGSGRPLHQLRRWRRDRRTIATIATGTIEQQAQGSSATIQSSVSRATWSSSPTDGMSSSAIHLDFFSGIGSATLAMQRLGFPVRHVLSWEVDEAAIIVAQRAAKKITKSQRASLLDQRWPRLSNRCSGPSCDHGGPTLSGFQQAAVRCPGARSVRQSLCRVHQVSECVAEPTSRSASLLGHRECHPGQPGRCSVVCQIHAGGGDHCRCH